MMVSCTRGGWKLPLAPCQPWIRHVLYPRCLGTSPRPRMNCCAPLPASRPDRLFPCQNPSLAAARQTKDRVQVRWGNGAACPLRGNRKQSCRQLWTSPSRAHRGSNPRGLAFNPLPSRTIESFRTGSGCGLTHRAAKRKGAGDRVETGTSS